MGIVQNVTRENWDIGGMERAMFSILNKDRVIEYSNEIPVFLQDLNANVIIESITDDWGEEASNMFLKLPESKETEDYRRDVFNEMKEEENRSIFFDFSERMRQKGICKERGGIVNDSLQKQVWFIRETAFYVNALEKLSEQIKNKDYKSEGLNGLKSFLEKYMSGEKYASFRDETIELNNELMGYRLRITYKDDSVIISEGMGKGEYSEFLNAFFTDNNRRFKSPFMSSLDMGPLETQIIVRFAKQHKAFFEKAEKFYEKYRSYENDEVMLFHRELKYYISFAGFINKMSEFGYRFCRPDKSEKSLYATGLYDLALACISIKEGRSAKVIANDTRLEEGEDFFVLTGPNQGGKTTFARSLGQLVYFTKMGLDVPAVSAAVPYYSDILTHFEVEESTETGRGKLMDELVRLRPMMAEEQESSFVVINELFTTAANYDACIMGKKVISRFIEKKCKGIYVTHLNELSKAAPTVVSLRAMLGENHTRTFKIERSEAEEIAGANKQAEKYRLTYSQLKERFS